MIRKTMFVKRINEIKLINGIIRDSSWKSDKTLRQYAGMDI